MKRLGPPNGVQVEPKPRGLGPEYAAQFDDPAVVAAYRYRPPHPSATIEILWRLIPDSCPRVLDVGTGPGSISRALAPRVDWVDAVDISARMIDLARTLPDGDRENLRWITGRAEEAPLFPPYGLITAADSLNWMDWPVIMQRLREVLAPEGFVALVTVEAQPVPWMAELAKLIPKFSTNRDFEPYDLVGELERRKLFCVAGRATTAPMPWSQSIADYIESIHGRNGFSRDRMTPDVAAEFDRRRFCPDGRVNLRLCGEVIWGRPVSD